MDSAELIRLPRPFTEEVEALLLRSVFEALLLTVVCRAVTVEVLALPLRPVSNCAMATTFSSIVVLKRIIANFVSFRTCSGVSAGVGIRKIVLHDIDAAFPQSTSIVED